jgi:hypothetical protein
MVLEKESYEHILTKIKDKEPLPQWYKSVHTSSIILAIIGLYIGSVTFVVWMSYDVLEKIRICQYDSCGVDIYTIDLTYEYAILALLSGLGVYLLYRSTDWPYVKERVLIVMWLTALSTIVGVGLFVWIANSPASATEAFYSLKESSKNVLPWRHAMMLKNNNLHPLIGKVVESDSEKLVLLISMRQRVVLFYEPTFPEASKPTIGSRVVVQIKLVNNALYVQAVGPL